MPKLVKLFEPIKVGSLELPNRIIMPAVTTNYDLDGDERPAAFYAEIARGGVALIIIGAIQALYPGRRQAGGLAINKDEDIPHLQKLTRAVHDNGSKAAAQLSVWNFWSKGGVGASPEDVSPSGVATASLPQNFAQAQFVPQSRPLTVEEIRLIERQIGDAAVRAVTAGFDAIELQATSGNLLNRFINPYTNRRMDEYGGSLGNRLRMLLETIAIIKKRVGNDFPFICRIPGDDLVPWGLKLEDFKEMAPMIEKAGVHMLSINPGWYETRQPRHQMSVPRSAFVHLAAGIKQVVRIPVATGTRINDPLLAEQILAEGKADLIAMARALIADPEFPAKVRAGRLEDIRLCTACCQCWDDIAENNAMTCSVNARAGREGDYIISPVPQPKKVLIIGGGPGGMEAARVAALRGHKVTLLEKADKLGGELIVATIPPFKDEWNTTVAYLSTQLRKLKVKVKLNTEATLAMVEKEKPDAVIAATGAVPVIPPIPGVHRKNVATAIDVLTATKTVGQKVVIVGGGLIGCETAEFLHRQGKQVTILDMLPRMADDVGPWNRWPLLDRLTDAGIRMEVNEKVEEIIESGVRAVRNGQHEFFEADSVVLAVGMKCEDTLASELEGKVPALFKIGACVRPRRVAQAIAEGFQAALKI